MGIYYNPPENLPNVARELTQPYTYEELVNQLEEDEVLFGHFDRGAFQNAPHLVDEREYNAFVEQVISFQIMLLGFYAMPRKTYLEYFGFAPQ